MPNRRHTIEEVHAAAKERGGICLTNEWQGAHGKYTFVCKDKHQWATRYSAIKRGGWCRKCHIKSLQPTIEDMHKLAEDRGGKCLSDEYIKSSVHLEWECSNGHVFKSSLNNVNSGNWCRECSSGWGERITRAYFEQIFNESFDRIWPEWLKNKEGYILELDGYNENLGIAFEHQGKQHYELDGFFNRTQADLDKRLRDDKRKRAICKHFFLK